MPTFGWHDSCIGRRDAKINEEKICTGQKGVVFFLCKLNNNSKSN
jgi:hypothetical protein